MSVVVDASVLVCAATDAGPKGRWAEDLVASGSIVAPQLALVEATNILRRLQSADRLTEVEATLAQRDVMALDVVLIPFEVVADRAWELRANLTTYDAFYVAVSEALGVPLATLDRRLARATGPTCQFLLPD